MDYEPKFNNKKFRERAQQALEWVEKYVSSTKPNWLSTRAIDQQFGQQQLPSSKWLRQQLLIVVDPHWNHLTGKCKTYIRNSEGAKALRAALNPKVKITAEQAEQLASGQFEYKEQSNRFFNPIQYIPKTVKRPLLASWGYRHNYDIACAAPRLVLQYARKCGLTKATPLLDRYINHTDQMRQELALELDLTTSEIKRVINTILNGGHISHRTDTSLFIELGSSHLKIDRLQASDTIANIKQEIKSLWDAIKPHRTLSSSRITPRDKSDVYRELEQQVIKSVRAYLNKTKNKGLLEHDGWTTCDVIDIIELRTYVRSMTGYDIQVVWELLE